MSNMYFPQGQPLGRNPALPALPTTGQDSEYTASEAQLRADINRRYADILQQLGYQNEKGEFIPGEVEAMAQRQRPEIQRNQKFAAEDVTKQAQREGTLFSGLRAENTARAEHPFVQALADLDVDVPKQLNRLDEDAGRTLQDYTIQNNLLLADSAARASARAAAAGGGWGGGGGGSWEDVAREQAAAAQAPVVGYTPEQAAAAQPQQGGTPISPPPKYKPGDPRWSQAAEYGWLG
jgi:hypothetical protein